MIKIKYRKEWVGITALLIVGGSIILFLLYQQPLNFHLNDTTHEIDAFMINFNYRQYDELGQLHSQLYSPKMIHYIKDNTSYFEQPKLFGHTKEGYPWTINAQHGKTQQGTDKVYFWKQVNMYQAPYNEQPETTIKSESMTIYPNRSFAETNQFVTISQPNSVAQGTGMQADFKTGIIKLLTNTKGDYVPEDKPTKP